MNGSIIKIRDFIATHWVSGVLKAASALCLSVFSVAACNAAEYFVDKNKGSDSYDGTAAQWQGGLAGPKKTIQAAVDLADGNGTIVTILPGEYDDGDGGVDGGSWPQANRILLKASNITLRSSTGKASDVAIAGKRSAAQGNNHGIGAGAMRCLATKDNTVTGCIAYGITFRDGCGVGASKERGGGIHSVAEGAITIIDCVVSNCASLRGGGAYNINAHSSLFTGNYATSSHGSAMNMCRAANCLISYNSAGSGSPLSYMLAIVNCTVANNGLSDNKDNYLNNGVQRGSTLICNTLGFGQADNGSSASAISSNNVLCATATVTVPPEDDTVTGAVGAEQCVSPVMGDFRPMPNGDCIGRGRGEHLLLVPMPDGYTYHDMNGAEVPVSGVINVGAYQTPSAAPVAARIDFETDVEIEGAPYAVRANKDWINPTNWPVTYKVKPIHENPYALYFKEELLGTKLLLRHSMYDGWTAITPAPDPSVTNTVALIECNQILYADDEKGSDDYDGTAAVWAGGTSKAGPKKTIQAAIDSVEKSYCIIYVAPGVYDEGGMEYGGVSNRVVLSGHSIGLIASMGPGSATIAGAPDPISGNLGENATRCVCTVADYSFVQGFVLAGGYSALQSNKYRASAYWSNSDKTEHQILDCIVSNNVGLLGVGSGCTAYRTRFFDNRSSGGYILKNANAVSCVFAGNAMSASDGVHMTGESKAYGCTFDCNGYGGIADTVECSASIFANQFSEGDCVDESAGNVVSAKENFADIAGRDYRLGIFSPACDAVTPDILAANGIYQFLTADAAGRAMPYSSLGTLDAGAEQFRPRIAMYKVVGEGGTAGILEDQPSVKCIMSPVELTAVATGARERPFLGFEVNGVMQPLASTTHVFEASADLGAKMSVKAVYGTNWYVNATSGNDDDYGSTPESPRRMLAAVARYAKSGDTIHAAEGTYDEGEMLQETPIVGGVPSVPARVLVKEGVALVADGAAENTFIIGEADRTDARDYLDNGPDAVRCVGLAANSLIRGFTLTGGHTAVLPDATDESRSNDNTLGGAVFGANNESSLVENCIITNNAAGWATAGYKCKFRKCVIIGNRAQTRAVAGRQCRYYGCLIDGNSGSAQLDHMFVMDSCTVGTNYYNALGTTDNLSNLNNSSAYFVNSIILAPKVSADTYASNCVFRIGCGVQNKDIVNCVVTNLDAIAFEKGYRPKPHMNVAIDKAEESISDYNGLGGTETDLSGMQRVMNGARDIGALEADWRTVYAANIGRRCTVTNVSPGVRETENNTVFLPEGEISGVVGTSQAHRTYRVSVRVTGNGTLSFYEGENLKETFEGLGAQEIFIRSDLSTFNYRFVYNPGEADFGGAEILGLDRVAGTVLSVR